MTPCQKCKAERDELHEKCYAAALKLATAYTDLNRVEAREKALRDALLEAIGRLNDYLSAAEGAPEPSENDTKRLVARLHDALQNSG